MAGATRRSSTSSNHLKRTRVHKSDDEDDEYSERKAESPSRNAPPPKGTSVHCDYCRRELSKCVHIRCAVCADFDLCVDCFANGVEVVEHKNWHDYRVIEYVHAPIFDSEWGADEEVALLDGMLSLGFGNWIDLGEHIGSKSRYKCEAHYNQVFMLSDCAPFPDLHRPIIDQKSTKRQMDEVGTVKSVNERKLLTAAVSSSSGANFTNLDRRSSISIEQLHGKFKVEGLAAVIGFQPLRRDFDVEYDNDFEKIICDLEFTETDTPEEKEIKLKVLRVYNDILATRKERKEFILERNILTQKDKRRSKEERDIVRTMNVFARFHSKEEHDDLIDGLIAEHRLRGRIQQLQNYRMLGIRTLAEGDLYEIEKRRKESQEKSQNTSPRRKLPQAATPITSSKSRVRSSTSRTPVSENPNMSALKDAERQLCEELDITPLQFAALKSSVIDESIARGLLNPTRKETGFLRVEINKTKRLFDFFISEHEYPITSDAMDSSNS